jgi:hypothetical protein
MATNTRLQVGPNGAITSGQQLLLPDSTIRSRKHKKVIIAVNSRDRNFGQYMDSNDFRWTLRRPLKEIISIELVNGHIPADLYNIASGWNEFEFGEGAAIPSQVWKVTLTPGQYTATELAAELQTRLNALPGKVNTYTVTYNTITRKITTTATVNVAPFTFYWRTGNIHDTFDTWTGAITSINTPGRILGFDWFDYTSSGGVLEAPYKADPDLFLKKLYLYVNADNNIELNRIELGAGRKDCFHILFLDTAKDGYYSLNKEMNTPIFYSVPAPIARITTLNISIRDEFYRPVDLGHHDFTLMFEITYYDT